MNARLDFNKRQPNLREDDHLLAPLTVLHSPMDSTAAGSRGNINSSGAHVDDSDVLVVC